jgi:hypothetical protein
MDKATKNSISHRGAALAMLRSYLTENAAELRSELEGAATAGAEADAATAAVER